MLYSEQSLRQQCRTLLLRRQAYFQPHRPWNLADTPPLCQDFAPCSLHFIRVMGQACATMRPDDLPGNTPDTFGHVCGAWTWLTRTGIIRSMPHVGTVWMPQAFRGDQLGVAGVASVVEPAPCGQSGVQRQEAPDHRILTDGSPTHAGEDAEKAHSQ